MWKQCRLAKLCFRWKHGNSKVQMGYVLSFCKYPDEFLRHFIAQGITDDNHHFLLNRLNLTFIKILLPKCMNSSHSPGFFHTTHPFQIDSVAEFCIMTIQCKFHLLNGFIKVYRRTNLVIVFNRQTVKLVYQEIFTTILFKIIIRVIQCERAK